MNSLTLPLDIYIYIYTEANFLPVILITVAFHNYSSLVKSQGCWLCFTHPTLRAMKQFIKNYSMSKWEQWEMLCSVMESRVIAPPLLPQPSRKVTPLCLSSFLRSKTVPCLPSPVAYCWDDYRRRVPKNVLTKHTYSLPGTRLCFSMA